MSSPFSPPPPLPDGFTPHDAAQLCAIMSCQLDLRVVSLDTSLGSRVDWAGVAAGLSAQQHRAWTPAACQRLWRWCAYGEDVGPITALLPDSDGEDDLPVAAPTGPRSDAATRAALVQSFALQAGAAAARGGGLPPSTAPPASSILSLTVVAACAFSPPVHAVVDRAVKALLGAPPVRHRTAHELFISQYSREAKRALADELADAATAAAQAITVASSMPTIVAGLVAAARDPTLSDAVRVDAEARVLAARQSAAQAGERLLATQQTLAAAKAQSVTGKLGWLWQALAAPAHAAQRRDWELRAAADERRWLQEERAYWERYGQAYRAFSLQPELLLLPGR